MLKKMSRTAAAAVVLAAALAGAPAQQPGAGQGPGGFSAFRERYKYTFQLMQMVRHIAEIDKDKKHALTPKQAREVLVVLKPLRSKPKLTQDEAKQALKGLKKVFTADQLNAMARIKPTFRPGGGQRPPGSRPGQPSGRPQQRRFDPNAMKDFNPFYAKPSADNPRAAEMAKRWNEFFSGLEKKAKLQKPDAQRKTSGKQTSTTQPRKR